jgi:ERCC4-type nuclease
MKIIRDTREKNGWEFPFCQDVEIISKKLDYGDYTTELLEDFVVIERKATATEIANNLGKKVCKERFYREFDRMKSIQKAYIVCEFPESDVYRFPHNSGMSKAKIAQTKMNGNYLRKLMADLEYDYTNVEIVFCSDRDSAEEFTYDIFKRWESEIF